MCGLFVNLCRQAVNNLYHKGMSYLHIRVANTTQPNTSKRKNCTNGQILTQTLVCLAASDWVVANEELTPANRYCIKNLTAGDLLLARVVAVNPGGRSEPGTLAEPVPIREVVGK